MIMKHLEEKTPNHPVLYAIKCFLDKLRQSPDVYPIKHYKKLARLRRKGTALYN
jgi:hypothetical protein